MVTYIEHRQVCHPSCAKLVHHRRVLACVAFALLSFPLVCNEGLRPTTSLAKEARLTFEIKVKYRTIIGRLLVGFERDTSAGRDH